MTTTPPATGTLADLRRLRALWRKLAGGAEALYELGDETAAVEMYRRASELAAVVFTRRAPGLLACGRTVPVEALVGDPAEPGPAEAALCGACNAATTAEVLRESG
jgi:hypothetical protein